MTGTTSALHEGFATYCVALFFEYHDGKAAFHNVVNNLTPSSSTPVVNSDADNFADSVVYDRGAWVLNMLRFVLGDDKFFAAMKAYAATGYTTALSQPGDAPVDFQSVVEDSAVCSRQSEPVFYAVALQPQCKLC